MNMAGDGEVDIVWSASGDNNNDASFIFVNKKEYGLKPGSDIKTSSTFQIIDDKHWWKHETFKENEIYIDHCNYRIPEGGLVADGWINPAEKKMTFVTVKDQCGNYGVISIEANLKGEKDDKVWPRLHINGELL